MRIIPMKWSMVALAMAVTAGTTYAQGRTDTVRAAGPGGAGPAGARPGAAASSEPQPYDKVITDKAVTDDGLFKVHKIDEKYFFEIADNVIGKDILVISRLSKSAAGNSGSYPGDQVGQSVIRFEKGPSNKIFLTKVSYAEYSKDSTAPMFQAVQNSNLQPIAFAFDIKAFSPGKKGSVIDVTSFVSGDNDILHFPGRSKTSLRLGAFQADKSYMTSIKSFPTNVEIKGVKTYTQTAAAASGPGGGGMMGGGAAGGTVTVEVNSSLVVLPDVPMQPRYFDPRVGYFAVGYTDFDKNPQGVERVSMIKRWRLEPKDADIEKYKKGELVEPKKPIIFYIDPATPKAWVPYLVQGVNDWQIAYEQAGFKNAIFGKVAPTPKEDSTWSLEDARHSAIVYKPSDIPNASGPSTSDPRSGEILESHINWYHNVMQLLQNWYFIQASPLDPGARKMEFDEELMGQLIRFVSSHEVGHTLGLRHNHGSSSTVPTENLRNKAWVEANGHTPSIMDYARFNYVAQPEDNIGRTGIFPRIGVYDKWAIEWGYRLFPQFKSADDEKAHLNKWVIEKLNGNKMLWFGTESNPDDPRSQSEQVGDDAMKSSEYGIRNLKRIIPNLQAWTKQPNKDYSNLNTMYNQVTTQFGRYIGHVSKYVGGIEETPSYVEQNEPVYVITSKAKQKEAVDFLNKQLFATPQWLVDTAIFNRTGANAVTVVGRLQDAALGRLLSARTFVKLLDAENELGAKAYTSLELLGDLKKGIWSELPARGKTTVYRRNLQKSYVDMLARIINPPTATATATAALFSAAGASSYDKTDVKSIVRGHLASLLTEVKAAAAGTADTMTKYHLNDVANRIETALKPAK